MTVLRAEQVVGGEHQNTGFRLSFGTQRNMDSHLVAVEVGVVRSTYQRMQTKRSSFHEDRLKGLNAETVKRGSTVQKDRVLFDNELQCIPYFGALLVHHLLRALDIVCNTVLNQLFHNERPEQFDRHLLGNTALIDLQIRTDNDNGTAGIVNTFSEKVLTETALLAFQHVGQRFQCSGIGTGNCSSAAAVVDQGVHCFLEHAFLVANNDIRSIQLKESLQTVVSVDDSAVKIVQIGSRESAAIQLNHGTQFGRNDRKHVDDHPLGTVTGLTEGIHHFNTLEDLCLFLSGGFLKFFAQLHGKRFAVNLFQKLFDRFGTHAGFKIILVFFFQIPILFLREELVLLQRSKAGVDNDVVCKVQNLFQHSRSEIQDQAHTAGNSLEVPDVRYGSRQDDMSHALTTHLGASDLNAAAITDLSFVADLLILAAMAFPILCRPEDPFTEQTVAFGLQSTVVDSLRFLYLTIRPGHDSFRRGNSNLYGIKR